MRYLFLVLIIIAAVLVAVLLVPRISSNLGLPQLDLDGITGEGIYKRTLQFTCSVRTPAGSGTGWLVTPREVITNYHVAGKHSSVDVQFPEFSGGRVIPEIKHYRDDAPHYRGKVVKKDPERDLALIELQSVPPGTEPGKLASKSLSPGDRIHTIGNPGASGAHWVYTEGTVRTEPYRHRIQLFNSFRKATGQVVTARVFDAQFPINPGDSGGPVVNDQGELVGVNCCAKDARQMSTCIDISEVRAFLGERVEAPASPEAAKLRDQGIALLRQKNYAAAVDVLSRALELDPKDQLAYHERGVAYTWLSKDPEAIADFTHSINLNPTSVAFRNRGRAYLRLGKAQDALDDFNRAVIIDSRSAPAYLDRSQAYAKLGKRKEAEADYQKAIEIDPGIKK
jgi:hypothetical protein